MAQSPYDDYVPIGSNQPVTRGQRPIRHRIEYARDIRCREVQFVTVLQIPYEVWEKLPRFLTENMVERVTLNSERLSAARRLYALADMIKALEEAQDGSMAEAQVLVTGEAPRALNLED